jgi:hypothetical protein
MNKQLAATARAPLLVFAAFLTLNAAAHAQATRTWVSGVGDDANPCSRTAPCKTFAGAISKTAAGGEINVLDPGGFGAVTITKSITISSESFEAGVLVSGTNGIVVNAGINDFVVLRGLDIEGLGTGLAGIKFLAGHALFVENCTINRFTQRGIDFEPSSATNTSAQIYISHSIIRNNNGGSSGGVFIKPGANVSAIGLIEDTQLSNNTFGLRAEDNSQIIAKNTMSANNSGSGFIAFSNAMAVSVTLDGCVTTGNFNGVNATNPNATVRIANCTIAGNVNGLTTSGGGQLLSFSTNNNADNGSPTGTITKQ